MIQGWMKRRMKAEIDGGTGMAETLRERSIGMNRMMGREEGPRMIGMEGDVGWL